MGEGALEMGLWQESMGMGYRALALKVEEMVSQASNMRTDECWILAMVQTLHKALSQGWRA